MIRRFAYAVALGAFGIGLAASAFGVTVPGFDDTWLLIVAGLALLLLSNAAHRAYHSPATYIETGVPELPASAPAPGDDSSTVYGYLLSRVHADGSTRSIAGLRAAAIAIVARTELIDVDEARERVYGGEWTTDDRAAAFLSPSFGTWSFGRSVMKLLGRKTPYQRDFSRVVDELVRLSGVEPGTAVGDEELEPGGDASHDIVRPVEPQGTNHWAGIEILALAAVTIGVVVKQPAVLLVAAVGTGYAAYARSGEAPDPELSVDRRLSETEPDPGDEVGVTVTVTNEGDGFLPDVRLVDVVPDELAVVGGTPRHGTALRPGESSSFDYDVEARRGRHVFASTLAVTRSLSSREERATVVEAESQLTCTPRLVKPRIPVPLRAEATRYAGQLEIDAGGSGIEFYDVREYRPGDSLSRVDWKQFAKTGELTTLEYRLERAARVVIVIDSRRVSRVAPSPLAPHAIDRSVEAAGMVFADLIDRGDQVGIAAFGPEECWLAPGSGSEHRTRVRELLSSHPAFSGTPAGDEEDSVTWERQMRRRLHDGTQVVMCTPLVDASAAFVARRLDTLGYPVSVVSPDPTTDRSAINRLATIDRSMRIQDVRDVGIPVIDWHPDEPFDLALARSRDRRSR